MSIQVNQKSSQGFWSNLLHMAEDVLTTVEDTLSFLWVQVEDEVSGVVRIAVLISTTYDEEPQFFSKTS